MTDLLVEKTAGRAVTTLTRSGGVLLLYSLTIFLGAALLFFVEPMFARMVLPMLGGSPAVWNTALLFYQAALLAGYAYVHFSTSRLTLRRQVILHFIVLLLPLVALPIAVPAGWRPPTESNPIPWMLGMMVLTVGLPFFAVSTSSSLLQRWFASSGHPSARDPYFLYAGSNLGSMLALLCYPAFAEPYLRLREQSLFWSGGYLLLVCFTAACALSLRRTAGASNNAAASLPDEATSSRTEEISPARRLRWVALAFVPSSLMLGVTTYLSTDIAAVPLLWVLPLALYLLSFILVFSRRAVVPQLFWVRAWPILLAALTLLLAMRASQPMGVLLPLHLLTFFVAAMVCHGTLAKDRPSARHLTEFYLWMSVGGTLGGIFNALLAPGPFQSVVEYPLALVLVCLLLPRSEGPDGRHARLLDWVLPIGLALLTAGLVVAVQGAGITTGQMPLALVFGLPVLICYFLSRRPLRFGLAVAAILLVATLWKGEQGELLYAERSFFGVNRVTNDPGGQSRQLVHGTTLHGRQRLDQARAQETLTYFTKSGPLGQMFSALGSRFRKVGVVGLGVGSIAAYALPGQEWTYYEIDPAVRRIAENPRYFTYLANCRAPVRIQMGDARLALAAAPEAQYDLLIQDAYSSDSVPVHLITREAIRLYLRKLAPGGLLMFQISNQHLKLEPVLANLAADAGLVCLNQEDDEIPTDLMAEGKTPSQWVVMARKKEDFGGLTRDPRWKPGREDSSVGVWSDDFSSIFRVFLWR